MKSLMLLFVLFSLILLVTQTNAKEDPNCIECTQSEYFWCSSLSLCAAFTNTTQLPSCSNGWCNNNTTCNCTIIETGNNNNNVGPDSSSSEDVGKCVNGFFPCSNTVTGVIILMIFYGCLLGFGAKLISDGSELLMEILNPGLIGGLLLPILGAVPDSAIIVVSGISGSNPQEQLAVGIGTLAGSTIMLLTFPWAICIILGRCDIRAGVAIDRVCSKLNWKFWKKNSAWFKQGISVDKETNINAKIMMGTCFAYLIVQGVAFAFLTDPLNGKYKEEKAALVGFVICFVLLVFQCTYQVLSPKLQEQKIKEAKRRYLIHITNKNFMNQMVKMQQNKEILKKREEFKKNKKASTDNELQILIKTGDSQTLPRELQSSVDVRAIGLKWKNKAHEMSLKKQTTTTIQVRQSEEIPEKEEKLEDSPSKIAIRAAILMTIGTAFVTCFSDPMVDVIGDFGEKIHVPAFFVSFIITPICSNASELISSFVFAANKRKQSASMTYSQLYGAATMNNTLCLGIFFALVYFKGLVWEFSAEVVTIMLVTLAMGSIAAFQETLRIFWVPVAILFYPLSIVLVYLLNSEAGWE